jgi:hypothetical protein
MTNGSDQNSEMEYQTLRAFVMPDQWFKSILDLMAEDIS